MRNSNLATSYQAELLLTKLSVRSPGGGVIVSCQDLSRNGFLLNDQPIRKTSVILLNGDKLQLPAFECIHLWKDFGAKLTLFDPTPPTNPTHKRIGSYIVVSQCLGTGSFATVHLALDPAKHRQVACKSIRTKREHEISQVMKEVRILMTLKHPNINEIYDTEENSTFVHIFLQLCTGGDLFTYITHKSHGGNRMCEAEAKYIMYQLLLGIRYLHDKCISHRGMGIILNLKPENILLHRPGPYPRILIGDFGLARPNSYQETFNVCGTVSYLPPEGVLALDNKHLGYIGMPADCWSAGVILYIMLCGSHPFDYDTPESSISPTRLKSSYDAGIDDRNDVKVKARIVDGRVDYFRDPWAELSDGRISVIHP
ncbi:hypothetical protein CVT24_006090 [Panaeolus cyanescens]|uniref:Protein kinase domain-containing protein n=1 Tax=Panaeolus cyanescens TaxID=181874 RepID=A0A409V8R9_9AGAR|nr:hypothetical protein CVT24_006090 [Panaeolus cyanescens]